MSHGTHAKQSMERRLLGEEEEGLPHPINAVISRLPGERIRAGGEEKPSTGACLVLPSSEKESFKRAAKRLGLSLDRFLLAGFAALLSQLSKQDVVTIGHRSPVPSVVTFQADGDCSFADFASRARESQYPRRPVHNPEWVTCQFIDESRGTEDVESVDESGLELIIRKKSDGLKVNLLSASGAWDSAGLDLWLSYLRTLWNAAAENSGHPVKHLPLLDHPGLLDFYSKLNRTAVDFPRDECVQDLIARQAAQTPDAPAVISGRQRYSYRELDRQSTRLARILVGMGAGPGRSVAICMERSADMPMALLAVLKAGSCYVPLDPQNPRRRLMMIFEECLPVAVLSSTVVAAALRFDSIPVLCVDQPWPDVASTEPLPAGNPGDLAYIIYTSGTTGRPKGVMIAHRGLTNLLCAMRNELQFSPAERMLAVATISFDIATMDMFLPLISGGAVVVADRHAGADPEHLAALLEQHCITVLQVTPITWRMLVDSGWSGKPGLKMLSGGESLPRSLANRLLELGGELWNLYGPTETTIYSGVVRVAHEDGIVPIGPPTANTTFYVMDEAGHLLPEGVAGELYIGGIGVGCGYLKRPDLTEQRFVADPFEDPCKDLDHDRARLFRTGDLVRIVSGGKLEFFGRLDHQVKFRGFRIELGEIETVLCTHPSVNNAVALLREDIPDEPRLVAYAILNENDSQPSELRAYAAQFLPEYMVPQHIVRLERVPLTPRGKVDRRALPAPEKLEWMDGRVGPENALERKLLGIFSDVLGGPSIGVEDSFFDSGGYSLLSVKLFARIKRELGLDLPISILFELPTVRALARFIEEGVTPSILVPIRPKGTSAPLFIIHSYLIYDAMCDALEKDRPIYGLREVNGQKRTQTLQERADLYAKAIDEVYPEGPACLAGWCAAGSLTVEVARRLTEAGHEIGILALFDSPRPGYEEQLLRRASWKSKIQAAQNLHLQRLRSISFRERLLYIGAGLRRRWERQIENHSTRHRAVAIWLQHHLPFAIPAALLDNDAVSITFPADYSWQPYPGKITLFRASEEPWPPGATQSLGWDEIAADGVAVEFVPGTHESMFRQPHLEVFGQKLHQTLRAGEHSALLRTLSREGESSA